MRRALLAAALLLAPAAFAAPPNIVLVSIDTLRADHLQPYGYGSSTAPFLEAMARRGLVYERAYVPVPNTTPSHASMLTGLYPPRHGALALNVPMSRNVDTLAEALQRRGYHTAAAVSVFHLGRSTNFDQGFADFSEPPKPAAMRFGAATNADAKRAIRDWKRAGGNKPLFLFVHYFDCHAPYGGWRGDTAAADKERSPAERIRAYDDSIRHVDALVRELHDLLAAQGVAGETLFCITSDHGEQIGERGLPAGHADIYTETIRVPLLFFGAGVPAGRVAVNVSSLDIAPSLAAAAGTKLAHAADGTNILPPHGVLDRLLFWHRGPGGVAGRELLIAGNPWYTRSIAIVSGRHVFIRNFDAVYRHYRQQQLAALSPAEAARMRQLALARETGGERRFVVPATAYAPFVVTVDHVPDRPDCKGELTVAMLPGFRYFVAPFGGAGRTRWQFSAARLDGLLLTTHSPGCHGALFYRLDRPHDAPAVAAEPLQTPLFSNLYAPRKMHPADELFDLDTDPRMQRNLIADPSLQPLRTRLESRLRDLYGATYGKVADPNAPVSILPREEIEKLKSLGYLF